MPARRVFVDGETPAENSSKRSHGYIEIAGSGDGWGGCSQGDGNGAMTVDSERIRRPARSKTAKTKPINCIEQFRECRSVGWAQS